jgi:hypothetical protein
VYLTIYPSKVDNCCPTFLWQFKAGIQVCMHTYICLNRST